MKSPTEKQIKFVEKISKTLNIKFPTESSQYNSQTYYYFIQEHINEYNRLSDNGDEDLYYDSCYNDVWCEHY